MKQKLHLWLAVMVCLILCAFFALVFVRYSRPMEDQVYDLSLEDVHSEIPVDMSAQRGWTVFVQSGEEITILPPDGYGCFEGLAYPGQTFYFSRLMTEALEAPVLQLFAANQNFSVFLDGELIYTDCPEQDNRIGQLTLPMREWDRGEDVIVALPENYLGKTLTIAQSTPPDVDSPSMATLAYPTHLKLYCSYAYESSLIAESFRAALAGSLGFILGLMILFLFLRKAALGQWDIGLPFLALAVFLAMASQMYDVSFVLKYFGIFKVDVALLFYHLTALALLVFLYSQAEKKRWIPGLFIGLSAVSTIIFVAFSATLFISRPLLQAAVLNLPYLLGLCSYLLCLALGWIYWRKQSRFYRLHAPLATAALLLVLLFFALFVLPRNAASLSFFSVISAIQLRLVLPILGVTVLITLIHFFQDELSRYAEKRLVMETARMAQQRYENLRLHNEEIMMLRHDMDKHFQYLRSTTTDPKTARYLDDLIGQSQSIRPVMHSGNEMLDTIISSRLNDAMEAGIRVNILRAEAPARLPMNDADLCSLIMNLMDNAVSAARASGAKNPYIQLDLHIKNGFFVFVCENTADPRKVSDSKEETVPKHGWGLKIVRQIVERYGYLFQTEAGPDHYRIHLAIQLSR